MFFLYFVDLNENQLNRKVSFVYGTMFAIAILKFSNILLGSVLVEPTSGLQFWTILYI